MSSMTDACVPVHFDFIGLRCNINSYLYQLIVYQNNNKYPDSTLSVICWQRCLLQLFSIDYVSHS